ncbi:hypothetical protein JMUB6875_48660 [Nocardia sp. JMUB6875]|uniref:hypothetical protein n=1 Tax=Nocardia sp. JMUB6875 TaxID=3158170 RepID=UPI0032E6794D
MREGFLLSGIVVVRPARVRVDSRASLITPYLMRLTGTYRCPPGLPARLFVAGMPLSAHGIHDDPSAIREGVAGGEVQQIDSDGRAHSFTIDLGCAAAAETGEPTNYCPGAPVLVAAKLYFDELADRLDWWRLLAEHPLTPRSTRRRLCPDTVLASAVEFVFLG